MNFEKMNLNKKSCPNVKVTFCNRLAKNLLIFLLIKNGTISKVHLEIFTVLPCTNARFGKNSWKKNENEISLDITLLINGKPI